MATDPQSKKAQNFTYRPTEYEKFKPKSYYIQPADEEKKRQEIAELENEMKSYKFYKDIPK